MAVHLAELSEDHFCSLRGGKLLLGALQRPRQVGGPPRTLDPPLVPPALLRKEGQPPTSAPPLTLGSQVGPQEHWDPSTACGCRGIRLVLQAIFWPHPRPTPLGVPVQELGLPAPLASRLLPSPSGPAPAPSPLEQIPAGALPRSLPSDPSSLPNLTPCCSGLCFLLAPHWASQPDPHPLTCPGIPPQPASVPWPMATLCPRLASAAQEDPELTLGCWCHGWGQARVSRPCWSLVAAQHPAPPWPSPSANICGPGPLSGGDQC